MRPSVHLDGLFFHFVDPRIAFDDGTKPIPKKWFKLVRQRTPIFPRRGVLHRWLDGEGGEGNIW